MFEGARWEDFPGGAHKLYSLRCFLLLQKRLFHRVSHHVIRLPRGSVWLQWCGVACQIFFYWSLSICAMAPSKLGLISCVNTSSPCGTMHTAVSLGRCVSSRLHRDFRNYSVDIRAGFSPPSTHRAKINPSSGPFKIFSSHPCFQFHRLNHFGRGNKPLPSNWLCAESF